nr:ferritin family protein [candidate division Zixibacteria bacterium]
MNDNVLKDKATLLKSAIKSEIDGYNFYDLLAKQITNVEARKRLENLRNDESRHRSVLTGWYKKIIGGEVGELPEKGISPLEAAFDKGNLKKFNNEIEYINLAMKAELEATRFYKEAAQKMDDAEFKKILKEFSEEENGHYEILMAEREAISGNYFWFSADGTSPMED